MQRVGERNSPEVNRMGSSLPSGADREQDVTASEIASFAYCAKAWHLQYVMRVGSTGDVDERRAQGVRMHERHGRLVQMQSRLGRRRVVLTAALLLIAFLAIVGALLLT